MFIFAYDKDSFEDQLKASESFWKCPPIIVKAIGLNNEFYGACPYTIAQSFFQTLSEITEKIDTYPDQYQISIQFEDLIVEGKISPHQIQFGEEYDISVGQNMCNAVFDEFFIRLCKHYHNRNTQVEVKEVIR